MTVLYGLANEFVFPTQHACLQLRSLLPSQQQTPKICQMENSNPLALLLGLCCHMCWAGAGEWCPHAPYSGACPGFSRKPGGLSKARLFKGGLQGGGVLDLQFPTNQAKQNQTGSSSLWRFPFCQTFQRMGDLLEKLNADIREWDNWIQVVHLVGYEYYFMGKVSSPTPCVQCRKDVSAQAQLKALQR